MFVMVTGKQQVDIIGSMYNMSFITMITYRDKPTHHLKNTIRNEGSYILIYGDIKRMNKVDKVHEYEYSDDIGKYRKMDAGFYATVDTAPYILKYGAENMLYTKDGRFRGFKVRKEYEMTNRVGQSNIWTDIQQNRLKYPTQKPYALLERIICLSTK